MADSIQHAAHAPRRPTLVVLKAQRTDEDASLALLPRCVLSRFIAAPKRHTAADAHTLSQLLVRYAHAEVFAGANKLPAIDGSLPLAGWPAGSTALRRLGMTQQAIRRRFEELKDQAGPLAHFDDEILDAFFAGAIQRVIACVALDGPGVGAQRAASALRSDARETVPASARRAAGPKCERTIVRHRNTLRQLMKILVELRRLGFPCEQLERWEAVPPIDLPDLAPVELDNTGVPIPLVRAAFARLNAKIARRLRLAPGGDELAALIALPPSGGRALFHLLRARVMLGLLIFTAGRPSAITRLRFRDVDFDHVGPAPDYRRWPVVLLRPGKRMHEDKISRKPLPPEFVHMILVYRAYIEHYRQHALGMSPDEARLALDAPLLMTDALTLRPLGYHSIRTATGGRRPSLQHETDMAAQRPLIVRAAGFNPDMPVAHRAYCGYNATAYRHTASQLAERAGEIWNAEHPARGGEPAAAPSLFATALQDHHPKGDPLRAIYGDRKTDHAYELYSGRAIEGIWRLIATNAGARKMPDVEAYGETRALRDAVQSEKQFLRRELDNLYQQTPPDGDDDRILHLTNLVVAMHRTNELIERCNDRINEANLRLQELRLDDRTYVVIADDAPPGTEDVDLDALETPAEETRAERVRDWVIVAEFMRDVGCERATICNWVKLTHLPPISPWTVNEIPVDTSLGLNYRRIYVDGIRDEFWAANPAIRERVEAELTHWPREKGWLSHGQPGPRCHAPLRLPYPWTRT